MPLSKKWPIQIWCEGNSHPSYCNIQHIYTVSFSNCELFQFVLMFNCQKFNFHFQQNFSFLWFKLCLVLKYAVFRFVSKEWIHFVNYIWIILKWKYCWSNTYGIFCIFNAVITKHGPFATYPYYTNSMPLPNPTPLHANPSTRQNTPSHDPPLNKFITFKPIINSPG